MTGCISEANLVGQGCQLTLFAKLLILTLGLRYFWKRGKKEETSEKGSVEIEDWGFSVHFVLYFQKIPFSLYSLHFTLF